MKIENNTVVTVDYVLTNDQQEELYSSLDDESIVYLHGGDELLDGLERALDGKSVGEQFSVTLQPDEAYGDEQPELIQTMHMDEFNGVEMHEGMELQGKDPDGNFQLLRVQTVVGDQVTVKPGYARNFLIPKQFAIAASTKNGRRLAHENRLVAHKAKLARAEDEALLGKLSDISVTLARKVGEQDKLYGSVTSLDIEQGLAADGVTLDRRKIQLVEPIKALGVYEVPVKLRPDLETQIKVWVVAE